MKSTFFALLTAIAAFSSVNAATYVTGVQQTAPFKTIYVNVDSASVIGIRQSGGNFILYAITPDSGVYDLLPFFNTYEEAEIALGNVAAITPLVPPP